MLGNSQDEQSTISDDLKIQKKSTMQKTPKQMQVVLKVWIFQCIKQTLAILMTISTGNKVAHDAPYNELSFINNS